MKTIKLTILAILLSIFSYGQSDTIIAMVNGTNLNYFDKNMDIVSSTDYYNEEGYKDYKISLEESQILLLHLYDSCKYCDKTISTRTIEYVGRLTNTNWLKELRSSSNMYYVDGSLVKSLIIRKPENE